MKTLPSKELLSAVLGEEVDEHIIKNNNDIVYSVHKIGNMEITSINIYELMHMMKEWLLDGEGYLFTKKIQYEKYHNWQLVINKRDIVEEFMAGTEFEAVTKACEWILKEIK